MIKKHLSTWKKHSLQSDKFYILLNLARACTTTIWKKEKLNTHYERDFEPSWSQKLPRGDAKVKDIISGLYSGERELFNVFHTWTGSISINVSRGCCAWNCTSDLLQVVEGTSIWSLLFPPWKSIRVCYSWKTKGTVENIVIGVGPFFVTYGYWRACRIDGGNPCYKVSLGSFIDYFFIWLGVPIATHAFPSTGDASNIWSII